MKIPANCDNTQPSDVHRRKPSAALLFSLLSGGLGHIYCGQLGKGVALLLITAALIPVIVAALFLGHAAWTYPLLVGSFVLANIVWFYAISDSFKIARRMPRDYRLKDYNRWYVYLLLIIMAFPTATSTALLLREGVCEAFVIPADSMLPTIRNGDQLLVDKRVYRREPVLRGDVVVFLSPDERRQCRIKRVVGLPGDVVEIKDGRLLVNGEKLPRVKVDNPGQGGDGEQPGGQMFQEEHGTATYRIRLAAEDDQDNRDSEDFAEMTVPPGHCFVLGDNRRQSKDSRDVGPIPLGDIVGRAVCIYWPRWEWLK
jgi:signal peptidase I